MEVIGALITGIAAMAGAFIGLQLESRYLRPSGRTIDRSAAFAYIFTPSWLLPVLSVGFELKGYDIVAIILVFTGAFLFGLATIFD